MHWRSRRPEYVGAPRTRIVVAVVVILALPYVAQAIAGILAR